MFDTCLIPATFSAIIRYFISFSFAEVIYDVKSGQGQRLIKN